MTSLDWHVQLGNVEVEQKMCHHVPDGHMRQHTSCNDVGTTTCSVAWMEIN